MSADQLAEIEQRRHRAANLSACRCGDTPHENALHDLAIDDVSALIARIRELEAGGAGAITAERQRQINAEGYTAEHDARNGPAVLTSAAVAYATGNYGSWPWGAEFFKPADPTGADSAGWRRDLVRAGALIAAAIDALDGES